MSIDTREVRKNWVNRDSQVATSNIIHDLCTEIERLRAKYETPKCSHCGHPSEKLHSITIEIDQTAYDGQQERFEGICDLCLSFACKTMKSTKESR